MVKEEMTLPGNKVIDNLKIARTLLDQHNLTQWTIVPIQALRIHGYCNWIKQQIALSVPYIIQAPAEKIKDTILHEIAHALTPWQGHSAVWKRKCLEIGASPKRCSDFTTARYLYICKCGKELRLRRIKHERYKCTKCWQDIERKDWIRLL